MSAVPSFLQEEASECGLACVAMVAAHFGDERGLRGLRPVAGLTLRGATLEQLIQVCSEVGLQGRAIRVSLEDLRFLQVPSILHWDMNHFVVLTQVKGEFLHINDPSIGPLRLRLAEASAHYTGVALEIVGAQGIARVAPRPTPSLSEMVGPVPRLRRALATLALTALAFEALVMLTPVLVQLCVDMAIRPGDLSILWILGLGFALAVLLQSLTGVVRGLLILRAGSVMNMSWGAHTLSHLLKLPVSWFENRTLGDVASKFGAIRRSQAILTGRFIEGLIDGFMSVVAALIMIQYSWRLALISLASLAAYAAIRFSLYRRQLSDTSRSLIAEGVHQGHFIESVRGIKTLKAQGAIPLRLSAWANLYAAAIAANARLQSGNIWAQGGGRVVAGLDRVVVTCLACAAVVDAQLTLGMALAYIAYREIFFLRASSMLDDSTQLASLAIERQRLADVISEPIGEGSQVMVRDRAPEERVHIDIDGVHARYGRRDSFVLRGCTAKILVGERVAITGASGAGKSSLARCLLGMLPFERGHITVNKTPGRSAASVMRAVLQDDTLFAGSIAENVSCFEPGADQARIVRCCEAAAISMDIGRLPMGYSTPIGDMGTVLSGGQRQRLILARAFYAEPEILILDEATSSLDVGIEQIIASAFANFSGTVIIIAHRPETIGLAGRALRLRAGQFLTSDS